MGTRSSSSGAHPIDRPKQKSGRTPFEDRLTAVHQRVRSEALRAASTDDPIIFHYTSPDGLIGILGQGQLWATSIRHFEDKSELLHAETIYEQVLDEIEAQHPPTSLQSRLAKACRIESRPWPPLSGPLSRGSGKRRPWLNEVLDIYVSCFSTRDDLVHQWKEYARGGAGFAIGLNRRDLQKAIQPRGTDRIESVYLAKVRYSVDAQRRELRGIFDDYCAATSAASPSAHVNRCADEIVKALALHSSLFKHPKFEAENEWRIIIETLPGRSDISFRSSADKVIPYLTTVKQRSGRLPLASVTIGAAMDQEASARGVQSFLDAKGYRGVKISGTKVLPSLSAEHCRT